MDSFGATILVAFSLLLGLNQALVKVVNAGLAPVFQGGLRSVLAAGVVGAWMYWRGIPLVFSREVLWLGCLNGTLFALEFAFLFLALDYTSVARSALLFYTMPLFVAGCAHFLFQGEQLTASRLAGLVAAFGGVAMVLAVDAAPVGSRAWLGDLLALAAAMSWAGITLVTRATKLHTISPEMNLLYCLLVSGPLLVACAPAFGDCVRELTPLIGAIFAFQVVVVVSLGFVVWLWVLSVYPVSDMASFSLLTPLAGVFFGWLIFDEQLTPAFVAGLACVCAGLYLVNRRPRTAPPRPQK